MATKKSYKVSYEGKSYAVKGYSPKQAKLFGYMKSVKGKGYSFKEIQSHRKAFMKSAKVA